MTATLSNTFRPADAVQSGQGISKASFFIVSPFVVLVR